MEDGDADIGGPALFDRTDCAPVVPPVEITVDPGAAERSAIVAGSGFSGYVVLPGRLRVPGTPPPEADSVR